MLAKKYEKEKPHTVRFSINKFMKKYSNNKGENFFTYLEWRYLMMVGFKGKVCMILFACISHSTLQSYWKTLKLPTKIQRHHSTNTQYIFATNHVRNI